MAADLMQSFIGKHVEKVVLAAAVLVFLGSVAWFGVMREPQGRLRSEVARLMDEVKKKADKPTLKDALDPQEQVALGIDKSATTVAQFEKALNGLPAAWDAVAKMVEAPPKQSEAVVTVEQRRAPERILAVQDLRTVWGRGVTKDEVAMALAKLQTKSGALSDIVWAGCVGTFDLTEQLAIYMDGNAPVSKNPITITKVELRRRRRKPDGDWSDWTAVPLAAPPEVVEKLPTLPADPRDKRAVIAWGGALMNAQAEVRRMPFYELVAEDPEGKTVEAEAGPIDGVAQPDPAALRKKEPEKPAEEKDSGETTTTTKAEETAEDSEKSPWDITPVGVKPETEEPKPTEDAAPEHVYATVWANDATVQPGETYQYQMRLAVLNPVWSVPGVKDEQARWTLEFPGLWSEPGEEVTIPGIVQFYFVGTFGQRVNLELHRWIHGQWVIVPSVPMLLGAPVVFTRRRARIVVPGAKEEVTKDVDLSPQALVVDVVKGFPYKPRGGNRLIRTNVLVYADGRGSLRERIQWEDQQRAPRDRVRRKEVVPPTDTKRKKHSSRTRKR